MNKIFRNTLIVSALSIIYPVYTSISSNGSLLEISNSTTIVAFIDLIVGIIIFLSKNGEFDILAYGISRERREQKLNYKEYKKLKEHSDDKDYLMFIIPGLILIIISFILTKII